MFKPIVIACLLALALVVIGCSRLPINQETELDRNWGRSFEAQKFNQIANPDAGQNTEAVTGVDGKIADRNIQNYQKGKKKPTAAPSFGLIKVQ